MLKWQQLRTLETREGDESSTKLSEPSSVSRTHTHTHTLSSLMQGEDNASGHTAGTRKQMNSAKKAAGTKVGQLPAQNKAVGDSMWGCSCGCETSLCQDVWKPLKSYVSTFNSIRVVELGYKTFQRAGLFERQTLLADFFIRELLG